MSLRRRAFLKLAALPALSGCSIWPDQGLFNPCLDPALPEPLLRHELLAAILDGLQPKALWDVHVHMAGTGDSGTGIWVNPAMRSLLHPVQAAQYRFYLDASCAQIRSVDEGYLRRLLRLQNQLPAGARAMLLAFDYAYGEDGTRLVQESTFHVPDDVAAAAAARWPDRLGWVASVHPYRADCLAALQRAAAKGAQAVKWLPPAMGIDPASPRCDAFYEGLVRAKLPLLVHAGEERAVAGARRQALGNPLRLRRALDHGVRVIVAHCASLGSGQDLDAGRHGSTRPNLELFARLMDDRRYDGRLFGEISGLTQRNRLGQALETVVTRGDWHHRLVNGSDYPLPAVMPLYSLRDMIGRGYISEAEADFLTRVRRHNALVFDLALKRLVRVRGKAFDPIVFHSRRLFAPDQRA